MITNYFAVRQKRCSLLVAFLFALMTTNPPDANAQFLQFDLEGPYHVFEGPYYIRFNLIYYYDADDDWTLKYTPEELEAFALTALDNLNDAFNKHEIYFYFAEPICGVYYKKEPQSLSEYAVLNPNALNIFVETDAGVPLGGVRGLPINFANVRGMDGTNLVTATPVLIHNVGHCLGLLNLDGLNPGTCHENNPHNQYPVECSGGPASCYCCGDSVCDTEVLSTNFINAAPGCATAINHPDNPSQATIRNYMSNTNPIYCNNRFTDGQAARMWEMLAVAPGLQTMQIQNAATAYTGVLPSGTYGNIVVENGTTLEIDAPIAMEPATAILVEKNATLRVGSTITGACDKMWRGIVVEGRPHQSQTATNQGRVIVHSTGKIEHAWIGVDLGGTSLARGGGILTAARGSTFENNSIGVFFGYYGREANKSRFWASEFYITDDYRANTIRPVMIRSLGLEQLVLLSPTFKDLRTQCIGAIKQAIGIELLNTSARFLSGTFENLSTGIYADQIDQENGSFAISNATFTNCLQSIHTNATSSFAIHNNVFEIANPVFCPPSGNDENIGVAIVGETTGFTFRENDFYYNDTIIQLEKTIGTLVHDTGEGLGNTIEKNSYTLLFEGVVARENNGNDTDGMLFRCNTFSEAISGSDVDAPFSIHIESGASVKKEQRGPFNDTLNLFLPVGNVFSAGAFTFFNDSTNNVLDYYYNSNLTAEDPESYLGNGGNLSLFDVNATGCAENPPCDFPPCDISVVNQWQDDFYQKKKEWQSRKAALSTLTDSLSVEAEKDAIRYLRHELSKLSSQLIQQYSLDTNGVKVDSIVAWLGRTDTYAADMRLARHHFFTADFVRFDVHWTQIPTEYSLSPRQQADYDELSIIYQLIRPHLQAGGSIFQMEKADLDSLRYWSESSSEAGYLTRSLLRYNGVDSQQNYPRIGYVAGRSARPAPANAEEKGNTSFEVYPNPANQSVTVFLNEMPTAPGTIAFYGFDGRLALREEYAVGEKEVVVATGQLPAGLYAVRVFFSGNTFAVGKVIISR